ncbi:MAG: transcriptional repressor LexA [Proteobacteria bacterium]|nr:transcriptional repressor LexA [Pseudomonadota bacterium]
MLTQLEDRILRYIRGYIAQQGQGPTLSEIGAAMQIKSKGTVHRYVQALKNKGALEHVERGWRGIRLANEPLYHSTTLPLAGRIAAGHPIEAIPGQDELDLAGLFVSDNRFALQVKGESMIDMGILDGDWVIIERADTARNGDVVVALIDETDATLKRFKRLADDQILLIPENAALSPLQYSPERVRIQGTLVGQLRSYA